MFTGMDKAIAAFVSPFIAKGVTALTEMLGVTGVDANAMGLGVAAIVAGAIVYFIPNKASA